MAKKWSEVASSDSFRALPPDQQDGARRQYFDQVIAPQVPDEHRDTVWSQFSTDAGVGRRKLTSGVEPSSGSRSANDPRRLDVQAKQRPATEPIFDPATGVQIGEQPVTETDGRSIDDRRTRTPGRVTDADIPEMTPSSVARDIASGALQIGPTAVKGLGDIARLATGDRFGKGLSDSMETGIRSIQDTIGSDRGAAQRKRFEQDMQDPALNAADVIFGNPGALADQVLPTVGSMALPMGVAGAAGKLATTGKAAQLAKAIDEATVLARAEKAREAATIGTTVVQNAADTYGTIRDAGGDQDAAYLGAAITAPATYVAGRLTGGGAEANAAHLLAGGKGAAKAIPKALLKEGGQEIGEEAGQYTGETVGTGAEFDANKASKRLAVAGTLGAVMGGGVESAGAVREARIKTLRDAGETAAADLLQQKHEKLTTAETVDSEIARMPGNDNFAQHYRDLRLSGTKPAEAAARSAVTVTYKGLAEASGIPEKALTAALDKAKDMPLDKVPGFLHKFTDGLAKRGLIPGHDGLTEIGPSLEAARDDAMDAAVGAVYQPIKPVMDDVQALESRQNTAKGPAESEQAATETIAPEPTKSVDDIVGLLKPTSELDIAAHDAATSPLNDIPHPTDAQKQAGNYKVGRVNLHGLNISIENPKGSERSGKSPDGTEWSNILQAHYGYIRGTEGNDGDHVDTFIGPNPESQKAFVVDQVNKDGSFDEHKVMLGVDSLKQADDLYHANYHAGWTGRGAITEMPLDQFKAWVKDGPKTEPVGKLPNAKSQQISASAGVSTSAHPVAESQAPAVSDSGDGGVATTQDAPIHLGRDNVPLHEGGKAFKTRKAADDARALNPGMRIVRAEGGFALTEKTPAQVAAQEAAAKRLSQPRTSPKGEPIPAHAMIAAAGGLHADNRSDMGIQGNVQVGNRKLFAGDGRGLTMERATEKLIEEGYLPDGASHDQARDLIKRSLTKPQYTSEGTETMASRELEARQQAQAEAIAEIQDASDNQFSEVDDADIPWDAPVSNTSTEAAMRALGFSEQEIEDAIANESGVQGQDRPDDSRPDESATATAKTDNGRGTSPPSEDTRSRSDTRRQEAQLTEPNQTPSPEGVSVSGFTTELRPSGTLAIKGNQTAILDKLKAGGVTKTMIMDGGIMVGKAHAQRAQDIIDGKPEQKAPSKGLSIGMLPSNAEPVTVKNGTVYIGKYEALNFDTGEPVTVPLGATDMQVVAALKEAGAIARKQRVFGLEDKTEVLPETANKLPSSDAVQPTEKPEALIELRKRDSVLKALRKCLGA